MARADKRRFPGYNAMVMPRLEAVRGGDGRITDVKISYPMDLTIEMLEQSGKRPASGSGRP